MRRFFLLLCCALAMLSARAELALFEQDGSGMGPLRYVTEWMGLTMNWDDAAQTFKLTGSGHVILLTRDSRKAIVDEKTVQMPQPLTERDGIDYIPLRFLADTYHLTIDIKQVWPEWVLTLSHPRLPRVLRLPWGYEGLTFQEIHLDAYNGMTAAMQSRLDAGTEVDAWDSAGATPLHWAAWGGQ